MKHSPQLSTENPVKEAESPHRIQVVFHRTPVGRQADTLAEAARQTADEPLRAVMEELDRLVGLHEAKKVIYEIYALLRINRERAKQQLKVEQQVYHMLFKGNPGTGKTTVARLVGRLFKEMGLLSKGHLIEVERADLVGEFIGHTAQKTRELIKRAMGGILFVDEAYSLARGGEKDFGKEAIDVLVKAMEDNKNNFVCILAGYTYEMDSFMQVNPGLPSRFPIQLHFSDYSVDELMRIADLMAAEKEFLLSSAAREKIRRHLTQVRNDPFVQSFSNARYVRNLLEQAVRRQAVRLLKVAEPTREELMTLRAEDVTFSA